MACSMSQSYKVSSELSLLHDPSFQTLMLRLWHPLQRGGAAWKPGRTSCPACPFPPSRLPEPTTGPEPLTSKWFTGQGCVVEAEALGSAVAGQCLPLTTQV